MNLAEIGGDNSDKEEEEYEGVRTLIGMALAKNNEAY